MTRYLVLGDPVVSLGAEALIPDGGLVVEDATIVAAGPRAAMEAMGPFDRVLGGPGHFVLPGFVNCHYHSELAIGPGLYQHIFEKANVYIQGAVGPIGEEDLYYGILWGLITAIKGGQTGTVDMYYGRTGMEHFGCVPALQAYADSGMRTAFGLVSRDQNIYAHQADETFLAQLPADLAAEVRASPMGYAWPVDDVMATFEALSGGWHGRDDRIRIVTAPDWTPACSDELYQRCQRAADDHGTSLITHALETRSEMMFSLQRYGKPAVRRLADLGVLGPRTVLEHFVWVTDDELSELLFRAVSQRDGGLLRAVAGEAVDRYAGIEPGRVVAGTFYLYKTLTRLDLEALRQRLRESAEADGLSGLGRQLAEALAQGVAAFGRLTTVCANAGICTVQAWDEVTPAVWQDTLDTNLTGVWNTMVAPVLGMSGLGYALYLLVVNLPALSGSDDGFVRSFPWIMLAVMMVGVGVSVRRRGARMRGLAQLVDEV